MMLLDLSYWLNDQTRQQLYRIQFVDSLLCTRMNVQRSHA